MGCEWHNNTGLDGNDMKSIVVATKEECYAECRSNPGCAAADFNNAYPHRAGVPNPQGVYLDTMEEDLNFVVGYSCHLKSAFKPKSRFDGSIACVPSSSLSV